MSPAATCATVLVEELAALGVLRAVLCPGSRSAPLAYALQAAEDAGRLRNDVRIDERGAAFTALGIAKATGEPVVVVTTSGTAAAELLPALAEARHSGVPVIAVTADRPATLVGTGANQTTEQVGLYGPVPRLAIRVSDTGNPAAWRAAIRRAVVTATGALTGTPGPVHLNVELADPLTGEPGDLGAGRPFSVPAPTRPEALALDEGPRTVIVAGDLPPAAGRTLAAEAEAAGVPLLAEPSSNARHGGAAIGTYRLLLPSLEPMIERVLVVGHPTLSRPVLRLLSGAAEIIAVARGADWSDPGWAVSRVVPAVTIPEGDPAWLAQWQRADHAVREQLPAALGDRLTGEAVAQAVLGHVPAGEAVVLGSSNPVRDADLAPIAEAPGPDVYANRGLAGIDGTIATAGGIALGSGRPTTVLLGDLTFLHDASSLVVPRSEERPPIRIVVADDAGGSIFAGLEYGKPARAASFERLFTTDPGVDVAAVLAGYGRPVVEVTTAAELTQALAGTDDIVVRLDRTDRRARAGRLSELAARVAARGDR